ncbi:hypothetical protein PoB_003282400 [Plakobranchus ocellatus]|uniref:Uncharacterized protein n=1 Tax=Plakobranchus ocellatus TaxID=259542 RepID=A0AAV4AF79_9GAST|nr:hypothetical protein PoB_003282400 [Plakobranchus ocellatus]
MTVNETPVASKETYKIVQTKLECPSPAVGVLLTRMQAKRRSFKNAKVIQCGICGLSRGCLAISQIMTLLFLQDTSFERLLSILTLMPPVFNIVRSARCTATSNK